MKTLKIILLAATSLLFSNCSKSQNVSTVPVTEFETKLLGVMMMVIMARGRYGRGDGSNQARAVFINGTNNQKVGEIATVGAPHIMEFSPSHERWGYLKSDDGHVYKIDLYTLQIVRQAKVGLTGPGIALSKDGKWLAI